VEIMSNPTRRAFLRSGLAATGVLSAWALGACGSGSAGTGLTMSVFGSETRQKKLRDVFALFSTRNPGTSVTLDAIANDSYTQKISTQVTGGSAPDLITMFYGSVSDYARRNVFLNLETVADVVDTAPLDQAAIASGVFNGKRVVLPLGDNTYGVIYDEGLLQSLGMQVPQPGYTWEKFRAFSNDVSRARGGGYFGTADMSGDIYAFQIWVRQRGGQLYTEDKQLGFSRADASSWFEFWADLRASGAAPPVDRTAESASGGFANSMLVKGRAATFPIFVNVLNSIQRLTPSRLALTTMPMDDPANSGHYVRASNWVGLYGRGQHARQAAALVQFMINDERAADILKAEFGAPPNLRLRARMTYDEVDQKFVDYVRLVGQKFSSPVPPLGVEFPPGSPQVTSAFTATGHAIGNGTDVSSAVRRFFDQAAGFLKS
jgi:multiple sugar transport system substrate-binding protein